MPTPLTTECPHCGKTLRVAVDQAGKRARCPGCRQAFEVSSVGVSYGDSLAANEPALETYGDSEDVITFDSISQPAHGSVGRFELQSELGQGGFGQVFRAYDPVLEREVALKLPRFATADEARRRRFLQEAKAAARLKHPHIVAVFESGEADGQPYIVSEFVSGETLAQRLKRQRPDLTQAVRWVHDLADALAYAHREGVVHRDIKPENIMLSADDRPQIMDFGLAKRTNEDSSMTVEGSVLGTPAFMSPEQARGDLDRVGPASDQYSLGATLYQLLTGQLPFSGPPHKVLNDVTTVEPAAPRKLNPRIPLDLQAIVQKSMEKDSSRRYPDISLFAADLDRWLKGEPVRARPISVLERTVRWCRKNRVVAGSVLTVLVVFAVGFMVSFVQWSRAELEALRANRAVEKEQTATRAAEGSAVEAQDAVAALESQNQELEKANEESRKQSLAAQRAARSEKVAADEARKQEKLARDAQLGVQKNLYVAQIRLAAEAWKSGARSECEDLLTLASGIEQASDMTPWEWGYLNTLVNTELVRRNLSDGNYGYLLAGAWSPDGSQIAVAHDNGGYSLFDAANGNLLSEHDGNWTETGTTVRRPFVAWSSTRNQIAVGCGGYHSVAVWDTKTGKQVESIKVTAISPPKGWIDQSKLQQVCALAWSPDEKSLAIGIGTFNEVHQIEIWGGSPLRQMHSFGGGGNGFCWASDSTGIMIYGDERLSLVNPAKPTARTALFARAGVSRSAGYFDAITAIAPSPDGTLIAVGDRLGFVRILDPKTGAEKAIRRLHQRAVNSLAWNSKGNILACGGADNRLVLWKEIGAWYSEPAIVAVYDQPVRDLKWSSDGIRLLAINEGRELSVLNGVRLPYGCLWSSPGQKMDGAWSPDGRRLAVASVGTPTLAVWQIDSGQREWTFSDQQVNHFTRVHWLSSNEDLVCTACLQKGDEKQICQVSLKNSQRSPLVGGDGIFKPITGTDVLLFFPLETADAKMSKPFSIRSWNSKTKDWNVRAEIPIRSLSGVQINSDGSRLAIASEGFQVWDLVKKKELASIRAASPTNCCLSPKGNYLAFAGNANATSICRIWDIDGAKFGPSLRPHPGGTYALSWHPSQPRLATAGADGLVKIWDTTTGSELLTLEASDTSLTGVAWSPDGMRLAAWGSGFVRLWDATHGLERVGAAPAR